ncbi:hypothetical protein [Mesorhizobium sp. M0408]|uniref:GNAT family N-acetyltransferase n=1 Tax=Mesorhizobium sp. M0408 TaxID=2956942 RepID=UPI0033359957
MDAEVKDNPVMHRFELSLSGNALAVSYYKEKDGRVILLHTEVPQPPSFNNSYAHLQDRFFARPGANASSAPSLIRINRPLATELGIDAGWLESPDGIERRCHVI